MRKITVVIAALAATALAAPALGQSTDHSAHHTAQAPAPADAAAMTTAEVRKVDKDGGKLTLKHDPIPNLDMPAMTMVFRVKDPAMLDQVKAGDKVRFAADRVGGQFTVIKIEAVK